MNLKHYGAVDSEDGLLLFGDPGVLQRWRGLDGEPKHVGRIEASAEKGLPGVAIKMAREIGIIWDLEGEGTTDVFVEEETGNIVLVRCWLADSEDEMTAIGALASAPAALSKPFGEFHLSTGLLCAMTPTESGDCIRTVGATEYALSVEQMMTESSGLLLPAVNGRYHCFHDTVSMQPGEARRCHLLRVL